MGVLKLCGKWLLKLIIPIVLIVGAIFYFGQGLQDASLDRFDITGIGDVTTESFTIMGNLFVKNPSDLSIPIESIEYDVFLKETGEKIGSGTLPSFTLEKSKTNKIPFNQEIKWVPTAKLVADLITKEKVPIEIKGKLRINLPKVKEYSIPFSQETDIKEYIQQFVATPIKDPLPIDDTPNLPINEQPEENSPNNSIVPENPLGVLN